MSDVWMPSGCWNRSPVTQQHGILCFPASTRAAIGRIFFKFSVYSNLFLSNLCLFLLTAKEPYDIIVICNNTLLWSLLNAMIQRRIDYVHLLHEALRYLPMRGTESDVAGMISATRSMKTVSESSTVMPGDRDTEGEHDRLHNDAIGAAGV